MLALLYLVLASLFGDAICRRYLPFASRPHRFAVAALSGVLISSWLTYLLAFLLARTGSPMLAGNMAFLVLSVIVVGLLYLRSSTTEPLSCPKFEFNRWDWIFVGIFLIAVTWMMFGTLSMKDGNLMIGNHQWSDFGSNVSIMQSFAVGNNFPTEYPHFSGDRIRYHFLYYFLAGNLEYLGLSPALANNVPSILTLISMLILVMTLGSVLFASRAAGRAGAVLFFVHGSLAYIPFLAGTQSVSDALSKIWSQVGFLPSGLPYRGEDWGVWTQVVYLNQRHLASSIGLLLIVIIFLIMRYREPLKAAEKLEVFPIDDSAIEGIELEEKDPESADDRTDAGPCPAESTEVTLSMTQRYGGFVLAGCLLGLMPMWNGAVFAGAAAVMAGLFVLLSFKKEMITMAIAAALLAFPQVIYLKIGAKPPGYSFLHWGYTVTDPSLRNIAYYLFFTFGFKWLLIIGAVIWGTRLQRKIMAGLMTLFVLTFCFQFSDEVLANHKFLNVWLVCANVYVGYGLVRLWNLDRSFLRFPARALSIVLVILISVGGIIDLVVVKNIYWVQAKFEGDQLVEWVRLNTDPRAIFLSHRYVNHGILMAGRRLFYGHPYYAWGAGYPTTERDKIFKRMFESRDAAEVYKLIRDNNITYVAIDDALRKSDFVPGFSEKFFEQYCPLVFEDPEKQYDNLKIYLVPNDLPIKGEIPAEPKPTEITPTANALDGGPGGGGGQFSKPRGICIDRQGNFYVADTGNSRIQKFSADGSFLQSIGTQGSGVGQLREPNGVAVDAEGSIYAVDAMNNKLIRFSADGSFDREWEGPAPGFYGPRDVAIGPNRQVYIVDQGRTRIVKYDPATDSFYSWGTSGDGQGQFLESTGLDVGAGSVFVCDLGNGRIQVFDLNGTFLRMWDVPEWGKYPWHFPDVALDERGERLYVTDGWKNEMLVYDLYGNRLETRFDRLPSLANPSSLVCIDNKKGRRLLVLNTDGARVEAVRLPPITAR